VEGLGLCKGRILRIPENPGLKIPHMGWNSLTYDHPGRLFTGIPEHSYVYFVHSYYLQAEQPEIVKASTFYSTQIHASVEAGNVFACQFHPEKSGETGLEILRNFVKISKNS
jgi:glutamine amidotransferase